MQTREIGGRGSFSVGRSASVTEHMREQGRRESMTVARRDSIIMNDPDMTPPRNKWKAAISKVLEENRKNVAICETIEEELPASASFLRNCIKQIMEKHAAGELTDLWDIEVRPDTEQWAWILNLLTKNRFQRVVSELRKLQEMLRRHAFFASLQPATRQVIVESRSTHA